MTRNNPELGYKFTPVTPVEQVEPVVQQPVQLFDIGEQLGLSLTALSELGIVPVQTAEMIKNDQSVAEYLTTEFTDLHTQQQTNPEAVASGIEPFIGITLEDESLTLDDESLTLRALSSAFDSKYGQLETFIDPPIWDHLTTNQLNTREIGGDSVERTGLRVQAMLLGGNPDVDDKGLYYTDTHDKTDEHGEGSQQVEAATGDLLLNPAGNVVLNAQRRIEGRPLLSTEGYHRFPQIAKQPADGGVWRPVGDADHGRAVFDRSIGRAYPRVGVRLLVEKEA